MAKINRQNKRLAEQENRKKFNPWLLNKIELIRRTSEPLAARASRWGGPSGVALVIFLLIGSFLYPKNEIQILKIRLLHNPYDFETHLALAENLLANNQFKEAEQTLLIAQQIKNLGNRENQVLGEKADSKISELWQQKHLADPNDIKKLIAVWEKIIKERPDYRDGYFQLAILNYQIHENEKAKEYLNQTLILDPNFTPAKELKEII